LTDHAHRGSRFMKVDVSKPVTQEGFAGTTGVSAPAAIYRRAEKILLAYFVYIAVMVCLRGGSNLQVLAAWTVPLLLSAAIAAQVRFSRGWSRVTRDWALLGMVLVAYRELDWFAGQPALLGWQHTWIRWDRYVLSDLGVRAALEHFSSWIASGFEAVYLSLYAVPAVCMGALYWSGRRACIDRFLTTLFLGTLCTYALLPLFPVASPRLAYPGQDLPAYSGLWRSVNVWLLDHCDISTGVFPSGHVAVAFSSGLGLMRALPERPWLCAGVLTVAITVFTATVYCRYHYIADGLASICIAVAAWVLLEALDRND
jgi:membrane-associated phospholipid phosphatase